MPIDDNQFLSAEQTLMVVNKHSGFSPVLDSNEVCDEHAEQSQSANASEVGVTEAQLDKAKVKDSSLEKEQEKSKAFDSKSNSKVR